MKQKSQNRFLAALLAVAMMLQMLPMLAFADDANAYAVKIDGKEGSYATLEDAVRAAETGDTIILGEGNYTLYRYQQRWYDQGKKPDLCGAGD